MHTHGKAAGLSTYIHTCGTGPGWCTHPCTRGVAPEADGRSAAHSIAGRASPPGPPLACLHGHSGEPVPVRQEKQQGEGVWGCWGPRQMGAQVARVSQGHTVRAVAFTAPALAAYLAACREGAGGPCSHPIRAGFSVARCPCRTPSEEGHSGRRWIAGVGLVVFSQAWRARSAATRVAVADTRGQGADVCALTLYSRCSPRAATWLLRTVADQGCFDCMDHGR